MLIDDKVLLDDTKVLLFRNGEEDYLFGKIVDSEISNYGNDYIMKYTVCDTIGNEYECNYKNALSEDIYFLTIQDCIDYLNDMIIDIEIVIDKMTSKVNSLERLSLNTEGYVNSKVVLSSIFSTKEQEKMFSMCARESMNKDLELHWDGKEESEKVYSLDKR